MPKIEKGESLKDYLSKCIPYVMKNESLSRKAATGKCAGMYKEHQKSGKNYSIQELRMIKEFANDTKDDEVKKSMHYEEGKYYEFTFSINLSEIINKDNNINELVTTLTGTDGKQMTIIIGNRFMQGIWISASELKQTYMGWNKTLHDINHMGSGYSAGFSIIPSDISYIVGYQDNIVFDESTNEVKANLHIEKTSPRYNDWKNYMDICTKIGRIPNVSVFLYGKIKYMQASDMPQDSNYAESGYSKDDMIPCMVDLKPYMVSTVTRGACDDKKGCGIK